MNIGGSLPRGKRGEDYCEGREIESYRMWQSVRREVMEKLACAKTLGLTDVEGKLKFLRRLCWNELTMAHT